uniref:Uncharacterized protein n=1 Tax=Anguilla anguilla TaxID=7936 RepID=A0A0E9PZ50_ANGAN
MTTEPSQLKFILSSVLLITCGQFHYTFLFRAI